MVMDNFQYNYDRIREVCGNQKVFSCYVIYIYLLFKYI